MVLEDAPLARAQLDEVRAQPARGLLAAAAQVFVVIEARAHETARPVLLARIAPPRAWEWLLPLLAAALGYAVA